MKIDITLELVIFDLGGVLVNVDESLAVQRLARDAGIEPEVVHAQLEAKHETVHDFNIGMINSFDFYQRIIPSDWKIDFPTFCAHYTRIFTLNEPVVQFAEKLGHVYRLSLLSNTDELHFSTIKMQFRLVDMFDQPTTSFEEHMLKPNPEIYKRVLQKFDLPPEKVVFIDDRLENVVAAQELGIRGIHYQTPEHLYNEF